MRRSYTKSASTTSNTPKETTSKLSVWVCGDIIGYYLCGEIFKDACNVPVMFPQCVNIVHDIHVQTLPKAARQMIMF